MNMVLEQDAKRYAGGTPVSTALSESAKCTDSSCKEVVQAAF